MRLGQAPPTTRDPCMPWLQQRPFKNLSFQVQWEALSCIPQPGSSVFQKAKSSEADKWNGLQRESWEPEP